MKRILILIFIMILAGNSHAKVITCPATFKHETPILQSYNQELGGILVYFTAVTHNNIEEIINQALLLQKSLLVNNKPAKEITDADIKDGFLIEEMNTAHLKRDLIHDHGSIMVACMRQNKTHNEQLVGYAILRRTSDYDQNEHAIHGEANFSISLSQWEKAAANSTYIYELAIHPHYRRKGIGTLIIKACQKHYSNAPLVADVIYWPTPFVNELSYRLFLKNGFTDIGEVYIENSPGFRSYKSRIMLWEPI
jgi:ribosomal protein S18 acetylase RimI-like enzyme